MVFTELPLRGAFAVDLELLEDDRGFFARAFCEQEFSEYGLKTRYPQCNVSYSKSAGTLRGMHFQAAPHGEAKVIRCTNGAIHDVIIDLRPDSPTFSAHTAIELTDENWTMLYVPEGFAHGFLTLKDDTEVFYMMSVEYAPDYARGVRWDDPAFGIEWPGQVEVISPRDTTYPDFDPETFGTERNGRDH